MGLRADHAVSCPSSPQLDSFCTHTDFLRFRYSYRIGLTCVCTKSRKEAAVVDALIGQRGSRVSTSTIRRDTVRHLSCSPQANTRGTKTDFHRVLEHKNVAVVDE